MLPFACGAWLGAIVDIAPGAIAVLAAIAILTLILQTRHALLGLAIAAFAISALGVQVRALSYEAGPIDAALAGPSVQIKAIVTSDPRQGRARVVGQDRRPGQTSLQVRVEEISNDGVRYRVRFPATLFISTAGEGLIPGDCLRITARGGRFGDERPLLRAQGEGRSCGRASGLQRAAASVRSGLRLSASRLPADARGLLPGLVVGDTSRLDASLEQDMRDVNLAHLTAVSGANLGIVAAFVLLLARGVGLRRELISALMAMAIAFFVVLARPDPSVLRAAAMATVLIAARVLGSTHASLSALSVAVIVLILANPAQARSPGFILSVAATAGLILWVLPLSRHLAHWMPRVVAIGLAVPLAAQAACTPFLVAFSGQLSLVGILTNFLAAPLVAPATIAGLIAGVLSLIWPTGGMLLGFVAGLPVMVIAAIARVAAATPYASLPMPTGIAGGLWVAGMTVVVIVGWRRWRRATAVALTSLVLAIVSLAWLQPGWPIPQWRMVACDVGQGDGLVLRSDARTAVVVDVGPDGALMRNCLTALGIRRVALLVITHAHADHMEGLPEVLAHVPVDEVVLPRAVDPPEQYQRLVEMTAGIPTRVVQLGERLHASGLVIDVLWPRQVMEVGSVANNSSTVLLAHLQGHRILLLADVEREAQENLGQIGEVDILKVAHHGSGNQQFALLDQWRPQAAVISVGQDNPYGHPHPSLLRALARRHIRVYRTDTSGALALGWSDGDLRIDARGRPFWVR